MLAVVAKVLTAISAGAIVNEKNARRRPMAIAIAMACQIPRNTENSNILAIFSGVGEHTASNNYEITQMKSASKYTDKFRIPFA